MSTHSVCLRFGTRGSALARRQTEQVQQLLAAAWPALSLETVTFSTQGDRVPELPLPLFSGKGIFTAELEDALRMEQIDCAVHSLKDLPTESPRGLTIAAVTERASPQDVLISRAGWTLETLPEGAAVGTGSLRRGAQLLYRRPDLRLRALRGNVDTRVRKALDPAGDYDAIVLAQAGVERLGLLGMVSQILSLDLMLPAPGQGAIAVQARIGDPVLHLLEVIHHLPSAHAVMAERAFLAALGGGCAVPVAAYAQIEGDMLHLRGRIVSVDGREWINVEGRAPLGTGPAYALGERLAAEALAAGAGALLERTV